MRRIETSVWSNFLDPRSEPVTAGMCLRRRIAEAHLDRAKNNPMQRVLGSRGTTLMRGENVAIAKTALHLGYTVGQFAELKALHLISKRRTDPAYLLSLYRHLCASGHLLSWVDGFGRQPIRLPWRTVLKSAYRFIKSGGINRRLVVEELRGFQLARKMARDWTSQGTIAEVPKN